MVALRIISDHSYLPNDGEDTMAYIKKMDLSFDEVAAAINYDPETGKFTWKIAPNRRYKAGMEIAATKTAKAPVNGRSYVYKYISLQNRQTPAARVAWLLSHGEWPNTAAQFKDGDPTNMRLDNLKLAQFPTEVVIRDGRRNYKLSKEAQRHYGRKRYYGLTGEQYGAMLAEQKGCCAICSRPETAMVNGSPKAMHVDHCHETGMIRALLCNNCNPMLGHAKDNPETLRIAADYIERHAKRSENVIFITGKGAAQ